MQTQNHTPHKMVLGAKGAVKTRMVNALLSVPRYKDAIHMEVAPDQCMMVVDHIIKKIKQDGPESIDAAWINQQLTGMTVSEETARKLVAICIPRANT